MKYLSLIFILLFLTACGGGMTKIEISDSGNDDVVDDLVSDSDNDGVVDDLDSFPNNPLFPNRMRAVHIGSGASSNQEAATRMNIPDSYLQTLKDLNVNWVGIMQSMHVDDSLDSSVEFRVIGSNDDSPSYTFEELEYLIDTFQENGFNVYVTLAFQTTIAERSEYPFARWEMGAPILQDYHTWPWSPEHPDHLSYVKDFWETYTQRAVELAVLLEEKKVKLYSLGTETQDLFRTRSSSPTVYPNHFRNELQTMVNAVRTVYSGLLTYDHHANQFKYPDPSFDHIWDDLDLDVIGVSAYFDEVLVNELPTTVTDTETLINSWDNVFNKYLLPQQTNNSNRPIIFLESGYVNSIEAPFYSHNNINEIDDEDNNLNGVNDGEETQTNIYNAMFKVPYRGSVNPTPLGG